MTGEWEFKLKQMEHGTMPRPEFMQEIRRFAEDIVAKAKNFSGDSVEGQFTDLEAKCPKCGGDRVQGILQGLRVQSLRARRLEKHGRTRIRTRRGHESS